MKKKDKSLPLAGAMLGQATTANPIATDDEKLQLSDITQNSPRTHKLRHDKWSTSES
jgi:hypothetical protein